MTDDPQCKGKGDYASFYCCLTFTERFKQKDSVLNTSAITAITKSSIKPGSGATANRHLCSSGGSNESKGKLW